MSIYPAAMEVTICPNPKPRRGRRQPSADRDTEKLRNDSQRRRERKVRRYTVANELATHATLTYWVEPVNGLLVWDHALDFISTLRSDGAVEPRFPYVIGVDRGEESHRLHAHVLLPRVDEMAVERAWPHGFVVVRGLCGVEARERAAIYLARPAAPVERPGGRVYVSARGFQPERRQMVAPTPATGEAAAIDAMCGEPETYRSWGGPQRPFRRMTFRDGHGGAFE